MKPRPPKRKHSPAYPSESKPWRILFVIDSLAIGGAQSWLVDLCAGLDRKRFAPTVCALHQCEPNGARLREAGVAVVALARSVWFLPSLVVKLRRVIRAGNFDIVSLNLDGANHVGYWATWMLRGRPVTTAGVYCGRLVHSSRLRRMLYRLYGFYARRYHALVATSLNSYRDLTAVGVAESKLRLIRYGVNTSTGAAPGRTGALTLREEYAIGDRQLLLCCCRLFRERRVDVFIRALDTIRERHPGAVLLIVGEGPEEAALRGLAAARGLSDHVVFAGYRANLQVIGRGSDIYLTISNNEQIGKAAAEIMSLGVPVVSLSVSPQEEPARTYTEYLPFIAARDEESLSRVIGDLLADPARRNRMGAEGAARVKTACSMKSMVQAFEEMYSALMTQGDRS